MYKGCLLYFGRAQKQIFVIENRFIFQIFPINIRTLLNAFVPIVEALLPLLLIHFFLSDWQIVWDPTQQSTNV